MVTGEKHMHCIAEGREPEKCPPPPKRLLGMEKTGKDEQISNIVINNLLIFGYFPKISPALGVSPYSKTMFNFCIVPEFSNLSKFPKK